MITNTPLLMHRLFPILLLLLTTGCAAVGGAALATEGLRPSEEADAYLRAHPETPGRIARAMERGDVVEEMTAEQVVVTWGEPTSRSETSRYGADTRWIYGTLTNRDYVYLSGETVVEVR